MNGIVSWHAWLQTFITFVDGTGVSFIVPSTPMEAQVPRRHVHGGTVESPNLHVCHSCSGASSREVGIHTAALVI
jgi:hypothetical protein